MKVSILIIFLLSGISALSQKNKIAGYVYSSADSSAVEAASVYFDGSTIGTITDADGYFEITSTSAINNSLVISAMGFESVYIDPSQFSKQRVYPIYLKESTEELAAVRLETDPWSRARKLREFKREFLGRSRLAARCTILNEEILILRYSPSSKTLYASAQEPLFINNQSLGYEIRYDLKDFYVNYDEGNSGIMLPTDIYYEGTTYFKVKYDRRKHKRKRKKAFEGSLLHFLRSLSQRKLKENKFQIFYKSFEVGPYSFFKIQPEETRTHVWLTAEKLSILYDGDEQSLFQTLTDFYIDAWGNHSPPNAIRTGGAMGKNRVAELVPIDYKVEK